MPLKSWVLSAVALVGALAGAGTVYALDQAQPGGIVGPQVRAYLLAHPEVITEAMQALQDRESSKLIAAHRDAIVRPYAGGWAGNARGDVTVVEYFDYNCGFCRASLPALQQMLARNPGVRLVYRELPILSDESRTAARVSLAAAATGPAQYRRFHAALYAAGPVSAATIKAAAKDAGVDPARVPGDADAEIARNLQLASLLNLNGTPSWVIGDRVLAGAQPVEVLEDAIRAARRR
ncbi:DsbA family protein [Sphingomonas sp.]|uniref:DsbA family protein n=1 Tax=Sphingomonas sp. TaxID=28214 RepID=UPI003CC56CCE